MENSIKEETDKIVNLIDAFEFRRGPFCPIGKMEIDDIIGELQHLGEESDDFIENLYQEIAEAKEIADNAESGDVKDLRQKTLYLAKELHAEKGKTERLEKFQRNIIAQKAQMVRDFEDKILHLNKEIKDLKDNSFSEAW